MATVTPRMATISAGALAPPIVEDREQPAASSVLKLSVVIPCLNEADTIAQCVERAFEMFAANGIAGEVIVVDNGSVDDSAELARSAGARVLLERRRGYGSAYMAGFAIATGDYILMADGDLSYDFDEAPRFVAELDNGADVAIGNRMNNIHPGAMPWHHRYIGNPLLSGFLNLLFRTGVDDAHCGMRAFRRAALSRLDLRTTGMEFASEMVIRAAKEGLRVRQLEIHYYPRGGASKLASFRDGWRHVRFLLVHSPNHLFIVPGMVMAALGALVELVVIAQLPVFGRTWDLHALIAGGLLAIIGTQVVCLGVCARTYAAYFMRERDRLFSVVRARYRLEHGLLLGGAIGFIGGTLCGWIVIDWLRRGLGALGDDKLAVVGATLVIIGMQIFFTSFLLSILGLRRRA
jgi:glycosyltransferase involved in cell wall biosynthesis